MISPYHAYLAHQEALEKEASIVNAVAGVGGGMGMVAGVPMLAGIAGHGLNLASKALKAVGAGGAARSVRAAGLSARKLGKTGDNRVRDFLNAGPGINYGAEKLPMKGLGMMDMRKGNKLTAQRGLMWAGNAAGVGIGGKAIADAMNPPQPPKPPQPPRPAQPAQAPKPAEFNFNRYD